MIKYLFTALLIVLGGFSQAQVNRVRNGSFEQYKSCPKMLDQVQLATFWTTVDTMNFLILGSDTASTGSCAPEYINACAVGNIDVGVPATASFYQYPRTGSGMMQVAMYADDSYSLSDKRNYLTGRLFTNLVSGKNYCITFYVNFNGTQLAKKWRYAVDHIGAYLDNGTVCKDTGINYCGLPHPEYIPQIYTTTIITDTVNWTKVQGSFVADGTEKFITIGNFFANAQTNFIDYPSSIASRKALYLIDDVSVIESTEIAHAGADVAITAGDSVHIGTDEEGMPCTWYVAGDTTAIGYSGGIWVKPDTTTTYVVEMDLCGNVTRDSVKVSVWAVGLSAVLKMTEPIIWPNPVKDELHIDLSPARSEGAGGVTYHIASMVGSVLVEGVLKAGDNVVSLRELPAGMYVVVVNGSGGRMVKRIVKQ